MDALREKLKIYPFNQNKLAEALTLIEEISKRDKFDPMILLDEIERETASCTDSYRRMEMFREILKEKRYPEYSAKKKKFEEALKKLKFPPSIRVQHSPFFEEPYLQITARLSSDENRHHLITLLQNEGLKELLQLID